jgi:hypothetical protein
MCLNVNGYPLKIQSLTEMVGSPQNIHLRSTTYGGVYFYAEAHANVGEFTLKHTAEGCFLR